MAANVLSQFRTIRRTRGDVLKPAEFRSIVEMIRGILKQYNYSGFNDAYQDFLNHLTNYDDPHHDTDNSFYAEIVERVYVIYTKMTNTPLGFEEFTTKIVGQISFLELIRRILLNRYLYDSIKRPDGSVPATSSVTLTEDWGRTVLPNIPVTISFGVDLEDEDAFLRRGWTSNSTPVPVVLNAEDLNFEYSQRSILFHTSSVSPYFAPGVVGASYPISLFGSSNDFSIKIHITGTPLVKSTLFTLINGSHTFSLSMDTEKKVEIKLGSLIVATNINCNDGKMYLIMTKDGRITLVTSHNSVITSNDYLLDFSQIPAFVTGLISVPLETRFDATFGLRELSIFKETPVYIESDTPIPMIIHKEPVTATPIEATVSVSGYSSFISAIPGYNLYLRLTGTWTGTVRLLKSIDSGINWYPVTYNTNDNPIEFTQNCDEAITMVTDPKARYRLQFIMTSGSLTYRFAQ